MFLRSIFLASYFILIVLFSAFLKYYDTLENFLVSSFDFHKEKLVVYDYIIGGGSAGSLVAKRLAEDSNKRILVIEAGKRDFGFYNVPSMGILLQNSPFDWQYTTVPQKTACFALPNNSSRWPMGKILGGTSMINNMLYMRGHKSDFDEWFKDYKEYDYNDILYYFKKLERLIPVRDLIFHTILPDILLKAVVNLGYETPKENLNCQLGYSKPKTILHNGKRWTTAELIKQGKITNIDIRYGCVVEEIMMKSNFEAYGVKYRYSGRKYVVYAKLGVILSAGVIGSAKILMLSGIGQKKHLKEVQIPLKVDLPVGHNLHDHVTTGFDLVLINQTLDIGIEQILSPLSLWKYFSKGIGPWTTTGCELIAFFNTRNTSERPDLQFMIMPLALKEDNGIYLRHLMGIPSSVYSTYFATNKQPAITILPVLLHPKSKGFVKLNKNDPYSSPVIDPKYLTDPQDVETLIKGIKFIKELVESDELKSIGAQFNYKPFPGCELYQFNSDKYWECYVRHLTMTSYHPIGTCKMGHPEKKSTVVNYDFQVKTTSKLFVVDGSVLPTETSGNINGAILMLAEMASDKIKRIDYLLIGKCHILEIFNIMGSNSEINKNKIK
ncbi:glucose dehydrogenase [FAD, quinone]-like isoform X2 [Sitophilus oryzae]|uniref:Glucose dehydrogenase [FAD, quinone]-like isoform X2 n=1 Tax=Sitophilus oryzae TaxID=7048 RepID=A0A6J2X1J5_SITOR|nr:glucose dehydrogenase [FAD, quinone]-like isoform X2 [Sitophilus oryzae]